MNTRAHSVATLVAFLSAAACGAFSATDSDSANTPDNGTDANCTSATDCGDAGGKDAAPRPEPTPVTTHPRLFLNASDIPRLRSWAVASNPLWSNGLAKLAQKARANMDAGKIPNDDTGVAGGYAVFPTESYAALFAFLSMVDATEELRADDAKRARTLLMYVIDKAAAGVQVGARFREPEFSTSNRSRWSGEGFALTVDWIYGALSSEDKATIRKVFLRWADENENAAITTSNHPEPRGVFNDPRLTSDVKRLHWATNNYYAAHMRNLGLMSIALDDADDLGGELHAHLQSVTGAWLYVEDALLRGELKGGLAGEGFEYSPQSLGYVAQLLLALNTAGLDSTKNGVQTQLDANPFWDDSVTALLHSVSPTAKEASGQGPVYSVAWYGDGTKFWSPDFIGLFGPLGIYDQRTSNASRLSMIRWIQRNVSPGGAAGLPSRAGTTDFLIDPLLYFMLFDPSATAEPDPRPNLPLSHFASGIGHILARTDWTPNARWFAYSLGWSDIDHQHGDGNSFHFYRKGEWLTKERTGYGIDIGCSDYENTLALQNVPPDHNDPNDYRHIQGAHGSQWSYITDGPGKILAHIETPKFVYAFGDATTLYQSTYEKATDVTHASRSIVWRKPDTVFVYDRAASKKAGRFKRFWLNLPENATVSGTLTTMNTAGGQKLFVRTLLPAASTLSVSPVEAIEGGPAELDPIKFRLKVEATGGPTRVNFLHVLEGADRGASATPATLVRSIGGASFEGAASGGVLVLFPVDVGTTVSELTFSSPPGVVASLVTGLQKGTSYSVSRNGESVTIRPGPGTLADAGGVLTIGALP
jgi:hypothetical protein